MHDMYCTDSYVRYHKSSAFKLFNLILIFLILLQMAKGTSLIVLDLRNNYGGVIQDAMLDASLFLGKYVRHIDMNSKTLMRFFFKS